MTNVAIKNYNFLASLDIDAQQCFTALCPNELPVLGGTMIACELNKQAEFARLRIGSKDAHCATAFWVTNDRSKINTKINKKNHNNIDVYWPVHAVPGTNGFDLIPGLPKPCEYNFFIWKGIELDMHPYGACYHDFAEEISTGLVEYLHYNKITHLVVGGLSLDFCVKTTVLQLIKAGFKVIVNLAATRGLHTDLINKAKQQMQESGAIFINNASDLTSELLKC